MNAILYSQGGLHIVLVVGPYILFTWVLCIETDNLRDFFKNLSLSLDTIGVIYEGYWYPHFLDWRVSYPSLFRTKKMKKLLSPAVKRGDLRRLNYNKIIFDRGSDPDPAERAHDALPDPRVGWGGDISSPFSPFASGPKGASFSFWIGTPTF